MDLIGIVARPALAWIFLQGGVDAIRTPEPRARTAAALLDQLRERAPDGVARRLPNDVMLVRMNAGAQIAAGAALALGKLPRLSSLVLAASLVPTTVGGHAFWRGDEKQRAAQRIQFAKNAAIVGGLLLAATRRGRPTAGVLG